MANWTDPEAYRVTAWSDRQAEGILALSCDMSEAVTQLTVLLEMLEYPETAKACRELLSRRLREVE